MREQLRWRRRVQREAPAPIKLDPTRLSITATIGSTVLNLLLIAGGVFYAHHTDKTANELLKIARHLTSTSKMPNIYVAHLVPGGAFTLAGQSQFDFRTLAEPGLRPAAILEPWRMTQHVTRLSSHSTTTAGSGESDKTRELNEAEFNKHTKEERHTYARVQVKTPSSNSAALKNGDVQTAFNPFESVVLPILKLAITVGSGPFLVPNALIAANTYNQKG